MPNGINATRTAEAPAGIAVLTSAAKAAEAAGNMALAYTLWETINLQTQVSDGSEYPKGVLLTPCKAGCGKLVPRLSFHYEECPNQP